MQTMMPQLFYLICYLSFFLVAQRYHSEHQIDEIKRSKEHDHREERNANRPTRRQHLFCQLSDISFRPHLAKERSISIWFVGEYAG